MPQMNGIDFIKQIREKYSNSSNNFQIKFMLITAFMKSNLDLHQELDYIKIDKIIEKPIRLEILKEEVQKIMNQSF
jgi:response regulator RpfG family c-di-GMP phosphodiesterase